MASGSHEPFFLRFRRELIHHEKSALSNPAQLLRLLTGQEHLHHRFLLINDRQRKTASAISTLPKAVGSKVAGLRHAADSDRRDKAQHRSCSALEGGLLKMITQIECQASPEAADRLVLDIILGTGRLVDDVRTLSNLRKAVPTTDLRLEALRKIVVHLMAAVHGMKPLQVELTDKNFQALLKILAELEDREASNAEMLIGDEVANGRKEVMRRWLAALARSDARTKDRKLRCLECSECGYQVPLHEICSTTVVTSHGCGALRRAVLSPKLAVQHEYSAADMLVLACRLLVLTDIALGNDYAEFFDAECASTVCEARGLALTILQEGYPGRGLWELQLLLLGSELRPAPQMHDARVPWPADAWQVKLLDSVDARCGALVLAPTSAGKTFAAYYVMEAALRSSNTAAVLFVVPTVPLAGQVEAEVIARFSQKPYPHDGYQLCGALIPGRPKSSIASAQIVITTPQRLEEVLADDDLWARLQWVVCDEIHMQPLPLMKALAQRCGPSSVPLLAMSATVQNPQKLRERLSTCSCSPDFRLVEHSERVVDLHTMRWVGGQGGLTSLHPVLLAGRDSVARGAIAHMAPKSALQLWDALRVVDPAAAIALAPRSWFLKARFRVIGQLRTKSLEHNILSLISEFLGEQMLSRREFRRWERCLVTGLTKLDSPQLDSLHAELAGDVVDEAQLPSSGPGPLALLKLMQDLRSADLLPCICFHRSAERCETLAFGVAEILEQEGRRRVEESRHHSKQVQTDRRAAYEKKLDEVRQQLEQARIRAAGKEQNSKDKDATGDGNDAGKAKSNASGAPLTDKWGYTGTEDTGQDSRRSRKLQDSKKKVEGDPHVRALCAALEALKECPPDLEGPRLANDLDFMSKRVRHVYGTEIGILVSHVEQGINSLGVSRGKLWTQAMIAALAHGVALHFTDPGCEGMNFAVQLLFRMGHVRVLLADESLGCGINLPCRAAVILDREIRGAALTQMAGRAGRRGLDLSGATVFVHDLETLQAMHAGKNSSSQQ